MTPEVEEVDQQQAAIVYCLKSTAPTTPTSRADERDEQEDQLSFLPRHFGEQPDEPDKRHFDRLNPNRRSLSSPNVGAAAAGALGGPNRKSKQLIRRLRKVRPSSLADGKLLVGADEAGARHPKTDGGAGKPSKQRRRTALGLISTTFRLNSQPDEAGRAAADQQQQQESAPTAAAVLPPQAVNCSSSNTWRNWMRNFLLSGSQSNQNNEQELVKSALDSRETQLERRQTTTVTLTAHHKAPELADDLESRPIDNQQRRQQFKDSAGAITKQSGDWEPPAGAHDGQCKSQGPEELELARAGGWRAAEVEEKIQLSEQRAPNKGELDGQQTSRRAAAATATTTSARQEELIQLNESTRLNISTSEQPHNDVIRRHSATRAEAAAEAMPTTTSNSTSWLPASKRRPDEQETSGDLGEPTSEQQSLVDRLVDSQLEWRQLVSEANRGEPIQRHLSESQIKRQEIIHELIKTERHHCLTLALMRQIYLNGLVKLNESRQQRQQAALQQQPQATSIVNYQSQPKQVEQQQQQQHFVEQIDLERLFPALEELIAAHELFFAHLRLRLVECCQPADRRKSSSADENQPEEQQQRPRLVGLVGQLGDLLVDQFRLQPADQRRGASRRSKSDAKSDCPTNGQKLLQAYGKFCGQHSESSRYYKQLMQHDKGFKQFIEQCNKQHAACRQRGIPECNLLVTQRLTKYPLLIEQLIKCSKDEPNDEENKLRRALAECRALLAELNAQLARKESFERLLDIYAQFSPKSYTIFHHKLTSSKFTKHDLLQHKRLRQLLHADDQLRLFSAQRRKLFQILCLILNDLVVFLRVEQSAGGGAAGGAASSAETALGAPQTQPNSTSSAASLVADYYQQLEAGDGPHSIQQQPVKYHFANIDNKSSVISLSKLLIREKAVEDTEPRVYLISSSPRQPEMYELAFMSRRHRATFVDKLKSAIERHSRQQAAGLGCWPADAHELEHELANCSSCSSLGELLQQQRTGCDCDASSDDDDNDEQEDGRRPTGDSLKAARSCELDQLELDIEQDVMPAPPRDHDDDSQSTCSSCSSISTIESTTNKQQLTDCSLDNKTGQDERGKPAGEEEEEDDDDDDEDHHCESGLSERARDSCDEQLLVKTNKLAASLGGNSQQQTTTLRQKLRRRRLQRPRQVSNQSTSSSSGQSIAGDNSMAFAADQQRTGATDLIDLKQEQQKAANEDEFDSGRGQDDSCSSSTTSGCSATKKSNQQAQQSQHQQSSDNSINDLCSSSASSTSNDPKPAGFKLPKDGKAALKLNVKPKSDQQQQRKLSTVSTMSSQIKLLAKLRASLIPQSHAAGANSFVCCNNKQPQQQHPAVGDQFNQLFNGCGGGTLNRQHQLQTLMRMAHHQQQQRARSSAGSVSFHPEQKLEELRNLRIQLDRDKQEWQEKFNRMQEQLLNERRELDLAREQLREDRRQVAHEREQLYRKLDLLKEKGILLSPSHQVIITSPAVRSAAGRQQDDNQSTVPIQYAQTMPPRAKNLIQINGQQCNQIANQAAQQQVQANSIPIHLSQQQQQQQQQQHLSSRMPFISSLPGVHFLAEQFGASL